MQKSQPSLFGSQLDTLDKARRKKQQRDAETLERLAKRAGLDPETAAILAMNLAPAARTEWTFVMISPQQNAAVVAWLGQNSSRPMKAITLWAELFTAMRNDTGEILRSRQYLAEKIGETPANLSRIMTELSTINAVVRKREGRRVKYYMNPNIATHVPDAEARKEARDQAGPLLTIMEGGKQ